MVAIEVLRTALTLGEGPHWDDKNQCLYFTDMTGHFINKYVPSSNKFFRAYVGDHNVSIIIPIQGEKNKFLITLDQKVATVCWDGESPQISDVNILYEVDKDTINVFNDGKCDPLGRLWAGTMGKSATCVAEIPDGKGSLYSFKNGNIEVHRRNIGISNGIAFSKDLKNMFYIDSFRGTVDRYDFDIEIGTIGNLVHIFTREKHGLDGGLFDGMTLDSDGNLWIAVFGKSKVIKIDPVNPETLLYTIEFPTPTITSVTFGGRDLDQLYVTSAKFEEYGTKDGFLFRVTGLGVRGLPANEAVL